MHTASLRRRGNRCEFQRDAMRVHAVTADKCPCKWLQRAEFEFHRLEAVSPRLGLRLAERHDVSRLQKSLAVRVAVRTADVFERARPFDGGLPLCLAQFCPETFTPQRERLESDARPSVAETRQLRPPEQCIEAGVGAFA